MPFIAGKKTDQPDEYKPLYERIQDWIFKLDVGEGLGPFRVGIFCLVVLLVILLYTGTQFYGLHDAEVMDAGQLARNLWRGRGYVTQNIRPLEISISPNPKRSCCSRSLAHHSEVPHFATPKYSPARWPFEL